MEKEFSTSWKASKQPRKQRKFRFNAPLHIRGRMIISPLSKDLRKKYGMRSLRVKKGDKVKIMRGQFKGKEGKVDKVDLKKYKIIIDKAEVVKKDGSKTFYPIDPSNVMIIDANSDDKKRFAKSESSVKKENTASVEKPVKKETKNVVEKAPAAGAEQKPVQKKSAKKTE
jgi:large subunit ribosomal protein L24